MRQATFVLLLCVLTGLQKLEASGGNAAVKYLRADVSLRQAYPLDPDPVSTLEKALESPLDMTDEKLVAAASDALVEFRNASAMTSCDWELSAIDGPNTNTSHRGAIRELVAVSGIRARLRFRDRQPDEAIRDWVAAYAAARQLSTDGTITSVLISYRLERELFDVLEKQLGDLSSAELGTVESGMMGLPPGARMEAAIATEKLGRNDLADAVSPATTREDLIQRLIAGAPILNGDTAKARKIVDGCGGSVEGFNTCIRKQSAFYAEWNARFGESPDQFEAEYKAAFAAASRDNAVIAHFTPSLSQLRWAEVYSQTRTMLLRAAVGVERDGRKALALYVDPSTGAQFTYSLEDRGFRLESQVKVNGEPLSVTVRSTVGR